MPIFSITPARMIEPPVGASTCASGSQVCSGKSGTLMAKASEKAKKSHMPCGSMPVSVPLRSAKLDDAGSRSAGARRSS